MNKSAQSRSSTLYRLGRFTGLILVMAGCLLAASKVFPIRLSEPELITSLKTKLDQDATADKFSGTVLIAKKHKTVFSGAYGLADREKNIKNDIDTKFRLGSMNKMFTAVAVLQLVQDGKIKLSDPLSNFLPDYPNKELTSRVTTHHLLTHTGGTGDIFGPEFDKHRLELRTLHDYVALFGTRGLEFEPGSKWSYSNYGFLLLGLVVESASGQDYYDYVSQHIFSWAGMTSTASLREKDDVLGRSVGYMRVDGGGGLKPNTDTLPYRGTPAGSGYSTVGDLVRFAEALQNHKLLDPQYTELLVTEKVSKVAGGGYAYGFMERNFHGIRTFGHGGAARGMNGDLMIFPQSDYVVAVLSNLDPPAAQNISSYIAKRLLN